MGDDAKQDRYNIGGTERDDGTPSDGGSEPGQERHEESSRQTDSASDGDTRGTNPSSEPGRSRAGTDRQAGTHTGERSNSRPDSGREQIGFSTEFDDLPHRVRTNSPSEERSQIDMKVGPEEQQHLSRLEEVATREFDEKVYLTDVKLAALIAGLQASDEAFLEEMRQIGYGYLD